MELPFHVRALRSPGAPWRSLPARVGIAFGASLATHPVVWFVAPFFWYRAFDVSTYPAMVAVVEVFAVVVEALYLRAFGVRSALAWSFAANAMSFVGGLLLRHVWPSF